MGIRGIWAKLIADHQDRHYLLPPAPLGLKIAVLGAAFAAWGSWLYGL